MLWERETIGLAGITYTLPEAPPPAEVEPPPYNPEPPPTGQGDGFGTVYVLEAATLGRTRDLSASSPTWVDIGPADGNPFQDFVLDSHDPITTGYLTSASGVWKSTDLDEASPNFSLVLTAATDNTALSSTGFGEVFHVLTSINVADYVAVFFSATVSGTKNVYCARSTNAGTSWNYALVGVPSTTGGSWRGACDYVPHLVSGAVRLYCCIGIAGSSVTPHMYRSDDSGANWSSIANVVTPIGGQSTFPQTCHVPYEDNADGSTVYVGCQSTTGFPGLFKSANAGASWGTRVVTSNMSTCHRFGAETWTQDKDRGFFWRLSSLALLTTDNAFSSTSVATGTGLSGSVVASSGGFPYNNSQFYAVTNSGIFVSTDRGETWVNKTGDWLSSFVLTASKVIVPVWVAE
jgi:hypothetical protein